MKKIKDFLDSVDVGDYDSNAKCPAIPLKSMSHIHSWTFGGLVT